MNSRKKKIVLYLPDHVLQEITKLDRSSSKPGSASAKSFGPVVVVNIPLVDRLIIGTCKARDAEGHRYFEVQGKVE